MDLLGSASSEALVASLLLLLSMLWVRQRQGPSPRQRAEARLDTVQAWPAQIVPVMAPVQRKAYELLRQALPDHLILSQTPLAQFMHVSTRYSYADWYKRAGRLRASFLVCDSQSNPVAAVDLRLSNENEREQARHTRLVRVLQSTGLPVLAWTEGALPPAAEVRRRFVPLLGEQARPVIAAPPEQMSGVAELRAFESTDFAGLDTMPAPLDSHPAGRKPRPA